MTDAWQTTPTLRGEHLLLRPTELADTAGLARAYDVETTRYFLYGSESGPPTADTVAAALASGRQVLTQVAVATGEIVGTTSLYNMNRTHRRVTAGYTWLNSAVRGTGINAESKLLLLAHCFDTLEAVRVEFNVDELNARSRAAMTAVGAVEEGALRKHARRRDGSFRTTIVYSVIDDDWPAVRARLGERIARRTGR